jgi:hypothetical protein
LYRQQEPSTLILLLVDGSTTAAFGELASTGVAEEWAKGNFIVQFASGCHGPCNYDEAEAEAEVLNLDVIMPPWEHIICRCGPSILSWTSRC